jgi:hypothetical protein
MVVISLEKSFEKIVPGNEKIEEDSENKFKNTGKNINGNWEIK